MGVRRARTFVNGLHGICPLGRFVADQENLKGDHASVSHSIVISR